MTECNLFCFSKEYNDENSFQQKRYRAFNKEVGKERYNEIRNKVAEILDDFKLKLNEERWTEGWKRVTTEHWRKLLAIPEAKDFKEGFEYISGVKIKLNKPKEMIEIGGKKYSEDIIKNALREYVS